MNAIQIAYFASRFFRIEIDDFDLGAMGGIEPVSFGVDRHVIPGAIPANRDLFQEVVASESCGGDCGGAHHRKNQLRIYEASYQSEHCVRPSSVRWETPTSLASFIA